MTKGYLLDTNVCAFYLRGKYDIDKAIDRVGWDNCYISEITMLELKIGVELARQKDGVDRSAALNVFFNEIKVLPIADAIDFAAKEKIRLRLKGTPIEDNFDLLIGATSVVYELVLVTENIKDFKNISKIKIENWVVRN